MMAIVALSIDNLLPAFVPMQQYFELHDANEVQLVISSYMAGFAVSQLFYGPLSDAVGRRPAMLLGMAIYTVGTGLATVASSFDALLFARMVQGVGAAAARILVMTIVRDRFEGREMARVMSFVMMIFIIAPVIAPASGAFILMLGDWRLIFVFMMVLGLGLTVWFWLRMPETLHPEYRMKPSSKVFAAGIMRCCTNRMSFSYTFAIGLMMGALMAYINSAQQIFETEVYGLGDLFPLVFALIAGVMGVASFVNARLVRRYGMHKMSHTGIIAFTLVALVQLLASIWYAGHTPLVLFCLLLALAHFIFSLTVPNFNALAMSPMGDIAGTASSFMGFFTTIVSAVIGLVVGQAFDGTVLPLAFSYFVLSALSMLVVLWGERGRFFHGSSNQ